ncbi:MAG: hypothetical protein N2C12_12285 [Planctomycetales bacterium]
MKRQFDDVTMGQSKTEEFDPINQSGSTCQQPLATRQDVKDIPDPHEQELLWQAYLLQQARRSCPGCGDDGVLY